MPCPGPRHVRRTLANISTGDLLSNLLSAAPAAARHRPPPNPGRRPTRRPGSRVVNSDESPVLLASDSRTVSFLNNILDAFIAAGSRTKALAAFALLKHSGLPLANHSYSILIKLQFLLEPDSESPYAIIGAMVKSGCRPDTVTYSTLISELCRVGRIEESWGIVDRMVKEGCLPTVWCFTSIVLGYCSDGRIGEAKGLIYKMRSFGCYPDAVTYTIFIGALCKRGMFDEVGKVLAESERRGWKPDEFTYNVYMNGLCKAGAVDEAFRQLDVMREQGLCPTMETLHILFDCLCRKWRNKILWEAKYLLDWDVDVFFYNTLMSRLCQIGRWKAVFQLWGSMLKRGLGTFYTFTIVIRNLCKNKMLGEAKYVFYNMGFQPDVTAFNTLLLGFNMAGAFYEVYQLFLDMARKNVTPNDFTYSVMIDSFCREQNFPEAVNFFLESIRKGFPPNLIARPIRWLIKDGKRCEILKLFEEMLSRGFIIDSFIFDSLIKAFCKEGLCRSEESDILYLIFDRMLGIR